MQMKYLPILFAVLLALLIGPAMGQGSWYPGTTGDLLRGYIGYQEITAESADDDQILNYTGGAMNQTTNLRVDSSGTYDTYFIAQPDVPRKIGVTLSASTTAQIKITGTDIDDQAISENITVTATTTGSTSRAFKTVTRIDGDLNTGETAKTVKVGTLDALGLDAKMDGNNVIFAKVNGAYETTRPSVTYSSTVKSLNTIDTNSAPGGYVTEAFIVAKAL